MGNLNNLMFFGEGVSVAGCLILHMLGQRHRFRLFDFCAHVCSVAETSGSAPTDPTMQVSESVSECVSKQEERARRSVSDSMCMCMWHVALCT